MPIVRSMAKRAAPLAMKTQSLKFRLTAALAGVVLAGMIVEVLVVTPIVMRNDIRSAMTYQGELAGQVAGSLGFAFRHAVSRIETLAAMPEAASMDRRELDRALSISDRMAGIFNYYFALDRDGRWVSYPSRPELVGERIPDENMAWVRRTIDGNRTGFLDVVRSRVGTLVSGFATPIRGSDGVPVGLIRGVIVVSENNTVLSTVMDTAVGANGYIYVVSAGGALIAHPRLRPDARDTDFYDFSGYEPVSRIMRGETGAVEYEYGGETWVAAYAPIRATGWGVVVQQPKADILKTARSESNMVVGFSAGVLFLSALFAGAVLHLRLRPLVRLVDNIHDRRLSPDIEYADDEIGRIAREFHSLYFELARSEASFRAANDELEERVRLRTADLERANERLGREIAERLHTEERLIHSLREKDLLITEVHHRVKNNMQVIISLMRLQARMAGDEKVAETFLEFQNRIQSMALVHERLYQTRDFAGIELGQYVRHLIAGLVRSYGGRTSHIELEFYMDDILLEIETALPVGLIVNELVSNAIRHAFPGGREGRIFITMRRMDEGYYGLLVRDDGVGLPPGMDMTVSGTLGLYLVQSLSREQLGGELTVSVPEGGGIEFGLRFKQIPYMDRLKPSGITT